MSCLLVFILDNKQLPFLNSLTFHKYICFLSEESKRENVWMRHQALRVCCCFLFRKYNMITHTHTCTHVFVQWVGTFRWNKHNLFAFAICFQIDIISRRQGWALVPCLLPVPRLTSHSPPWSVLPSEWPHLHRWKLAGRRQSGRHA